MGRQRTLDDTLPRWESAGSHSTSANVTELRRRRTPGGPPSSKEPTTPSEQIRSALGLLWIIGAAVIVLLCLAFTVGAALMFGVLHSIAGARNYGAATDRMGQYEQFFAKVSKAGFTVVSDPPTINEGVKFYLWTVTPPGTQALSAFSWSHDLKSNQVRPTSNAAALLDVDEKNITAAQAQEYSTVHTRNADGTEYVTQVYTWNPKDQIALSIIKVDAGAFAPSDPRGWAGAKVADAAPPIPPPLIDPKSRTRAAVGGVPDNPDQPPPAEATAGENGPPGAANQVAPGDGTQPPAQDQPGTDQPVQPGDGNANGNTDAGTPDLRGASTPPADNGGAGSEAKGDAGRAGDANTVGGGAPATGAGDSGKTDSKDSSKGLKKLKKKLKIRLPSKPKKEGDATPVG